MTHYVEHEGKQKLLVTVHSMDTNEGKRCIGCHVTSMDGGVESQALVIDRAVRPKTRHGMLAAVSFTQP